MGANLAIFNLFSKRQADAAKAGAADVYQYDQIPGPLRVQVHQIAIEGLGKVGSRGDRYMTAYEENDWWKQIEQVFLREKGLDGIGSAEFAGNRVLGHMRTCSTNDWLDLLELISIGIMAVGDADQGYFRQMWHVRGQAADHLEEINYRLRQSGVGYQVEGNQIVRVDSQYVHAEVVKPALALLADAEFEGARQEFLAAHSHYRAKENRQAVAMAANALESTFKAIFDRKGWPYAKGARISDLVKVARQNRLWPDYLDTSFDQLVATLQSGLPKIRDNDAAHGQGATPKEVPSYIAAYALHLAASKIVFIAEAAK